MKYAYASDTFNEKILFQNQSTNEGYSNNKIYLGKLNHISVSKSNDKAQIYNNLIRYNSFNIDKNRKHFEQSNNGHKKLILNHFKKLIIVVSIQKKFEEQ